MSVLAFKDGIMETIGNPYIAGYEWFRYSRHCAFAPRFRHRVPNPDIRETTWISLWVYWDTVPGGESPIPEADSKGARASLYESGSYCGEFRHQSQDHTSYVPKPSAPSGGFFLKRTKSV
jgi:hypothetical protein